MAGKYTGRKPLQMADGRIIKTNDIVNEITDEQAEVLYNFEPVTQIKKETKKKEKESYDE